MLVAHAAEYAPLSSLTVTLPPETKDGSSFTGPTVMVKLCGADVSAPPPLSESVTVMVELPNAFALSEKLRTPVDEIDGPLAKSDGLLLPVMLKVTVWPDSSAGPALMPVAQAAE